MGQFLAMGLAHEIVVSRDDLKKKKISIEELRQEMEKSLLLDLSLYDETEKDNYLVFKLKDSILETDLIPFLEVLHPLVYGERNADEYNEVLKELRSTPSSEWIDLAKRQSFEAFQYDVYGESCYIEFPKAFQPTIRLSVKRVAIYYGHGKISTEGIDEFTDFFNYCIRKTFKEHPIAKSVQVYISG